MELKIPIYERSRKFGYLFWKKEHDEKIKNLLGDLLYVKVYLMNSFLGEKRIDWKHRRISLGYKWTRMLLKDCTHFTIKKTSEDTIHISCEKVKKKINRN